MIDTPGSGPRPGTAAPARKTTRSLLLWAILAVVLAFFIGFFWQWYVAGNVREELTRTEQELQVERLRLHLARATLAAQAGDFEGARGLMSDFFTRLQERRGELPDDLDPAAGEILTQRDDVITGLSRANPRYAGVLRRMLGLLAPEMAAETAVEPATGPPVDETDTGAGEPVVAPDTGG